MKKDILDYIAFSIHILLWGVLLVGVVFLGWKLVVHPYEFGNWLGEIINGIMSVIKK